MASTALVPFDSPDAVDLALFEGFDLTSEIDALSGGISSGFAVVSIRGKNWRVKHGGEDTLIRDENNDPVRRLNMIIVGVSPAITKTYYAGAYESGANEAPDCMSSDGIRPDAGVADPQNDLCATCPMNQFGSATMNDGRRAKACQDNKRLAVVPAKDIRNEQFGGAMLLRVPPGSLPSLVSLRKQLQQHGLPPFAVVVEVSFDPESEYPKLIFTPKARINDASVLDVVMEVKRSVVTESILNGAAVSAPAKPKEPAKPTPPPARKPRGGAAKKKAAAAEPDQSDEKTEGDDGSEAEAEAEAEAEVATKPAKARAEKPAPTLDSQQDTALGDLLGGLLGG